MQAKLDTGASRKSFCTEMKDDNSWIVQLDLNSSAKNQSGHDTSGQSLDVSSTVLNELDENTKDTWFFPIKGFEKRDYQYNISKSTLFHNTLVILPTGLGKTFISSVTIYNFMRWFPQSKIVFMAPTRPLVHQQISACYDVVGISKSETAEMTGKTISKNKRKDEWDSKRVFFATPQVIQSDIKEGIFPCSSIKLLVFDEAHKAKGDYAYCKVIREIFRVNKNFRVLGLTATAGKTDDVIQIIQNLLISKIEYRSETSMDVQRYTHKKMIEIVPVKLCDELNDIYEHFMKEVDPIIRELRKSNAIHSNQISKGYLIIQKKKLMDNSAIPNHLKSQTLSNFSAAIGFYHSLEILQRHSVHLFLKSLRDEDNKTTYKFFIARNFKLSRYVKELDEKYDSVSPFKINVNPLPNGAIPVIPPDQVINFGHKKFDILKMKLREYFDNSGTKAIVFCEYRDTTHLIYTLLLQLRPQVMANVLIGQGGAISQKDQMQIMKNFRDGATNTLICTCVAEEGLDIGDVDLVICFDINTKNAVRFVQRIGRTARKRNGKVIILATEGKELAMSRELVYSKDQMNKSITKNKDIHKYFFKAVKLFPEDFDPKCIEMKFVLQDENDQQSCSTSKGKKSTNVQPRKNLGPINSRGAITNYLKPITKSTENFIQPIICQNKADEICAVKNQIELMDVVMESHEAEINFNEHIEKCQIYVDKFIEENHIKEGSYLKTYIEHCTKKKIDLMTTFLEKLKAPICEKVDFELSDTEIDISCVSAKKSDFEIYVKRRECLRKKQAVLKKENRIKDIFISPVKKLEKCQDQKSFTFNSPIPLNFSAVRNSSTPIRKILSPMNDSLRVTKSSNNLKNPSLDREISSVSLSRFHNQQNTSADAENMQINPKRFEFLGIMSIDDIFEGCDSCIDYNISKNTENIQKSPEEQNDIVECSVQEEPKQIWRQESLKFLNINNIDDIFEESDSFSKSKNTENINKSSVEQKDVVECSVQEEQKQVCSLDSLKFLNIHNIDDIFESSSEATSIKDTEKNINQQEDDYSSDKTEIYDVEEEIARIQLNLSKSHSDINIEEKSEKENRVLNKKDEPISKSNQLKPNLSKLMCNIQNSTSFVNKNIETALLDFRNMATQPFERCTTPKCQEITARSNESTPDLPNNNLVKSNSSPLTSRFKGRRKRRALNFKIKKPRNNFLQTQAVVDDTDSSDEEHETSMTSLNGFVCNETVHDDTMMFAKYVKSLDSPSAGRNNRFVFRELQPQAYKSDIFSQVPNEETDSDDMSSFIVEDDGSIDSEIDDLEMAEMILKQKRKASNRGNNRAEKNKKRKIVLADLSSEDEIEKMRNEVFQKPN